MMRKAKVALLVLLICTALLLCACGQNKCNHEYYDEIVAPTCVENGYTVHTCTLCGYSYTDEETPKTGHEWKKAIKAASCTEGGLEGNFCTICGEAASDIKTTAPLGHSLDTKSKKTVEPTCTEGGYYVSTCTVCHATVEEEYVPVSHPGHDYKPTENPDGSVAYVCSVCKDTYSINSFLDYKTYQAECDAVRAQQVKDAPSHLAELADWVAEKDKSANAYDILTQSEADLLLKEKSARYQSLSDAENDTEILFRAIKHAYGPYQYFGGDDRFGEAEADVYAALSGKKYLSAKEYTQILLEALSFVRDAHFQIGTTSLGDNAYSRYEYSYAKGVYFSKDSDGFYQIVDGEKLYYDGCENENVSIKPTLCENGKIAYGLVRFCRIYNIDGTEARNFDIISLKRGGKTEEKTVFWTLSEEYPDKRSADYDMILENGIAYVSIRRAFDPEDAVSLEKYVADAAKLKNAKCIIYDIRHHIGGSSRYSADWVENLSGVYPSVPSIFTRRYNKLNPGRLYAQFNDGNRIPNDIPIIVLVDDCCASSGENTLNNAKCMDNVIVIGSNSCGYMIGGNVFTFYLPNTGIPVTFGCTFSLLYTEEEVDAKGYEPDIWCNPKDALQNAIAMIYEYDIVDDGAFDEFLAHHRELLKK